MEQKHGMFPRNYLDPFLNNLNCNASIVGHTPVKGIELHGNQLVVSSSFGWEKKLMWSSFSKQTSIRLRPS